MSIGKISAVVSSPAAYHLLGPIYFSRGAAACGSWEIQHIFPTQTLGGAR